MEPISGLPRDVLDLVVQRNPSLTRVVKDELPPVTAPVIPLVCLHEGAVLEWCSSCRGGKAESRHVRDCDIHGKCTRESVSSLVQSCDKCPDFTVFDVVAKRHLIYHMLPIAGNGVWRRGIDQLRCRWDTFTGSKIVAVMVDTRPGWLDSLSEVRDYLPKDCDVIPLRNNPSLREVVSWEPLWDAVLSVAGDNDAILYAHAKGVTRNVDPGNSCQWWASLLYSLSLDHIDLVDRQLKRYPITGSFKKMGRCFVGSKSTWHYSGSFFWVRAGDFRQRAWRAVDRKWWGNESWVGTAYRFSDAGCIFYESPRIECDLYNPKLWDSVIRPRYSEWLQKNPPVWSWIKAMIRSAGG